ncbi:tryptophan-rich antigen [Plasmodium gonderi]|uniref:Tryptophan-rich antigen n=1 Tax=Plasmodium gonderi TaxID=77519 RepID=A0A1Y1JC09_PLAGO|nr:tryptophan-rich antigen [Plasmodium gonderi]GAW79208.1 tryptophan-rich antigen [Plasmodium gonderi]
MTGRHLFSHFTKTLVILFSVYVYDYCKDDGCLNKSIVNVQKLNKSSRSKTIRLLARLDPLSQSNKTNLKTPPKGADLKKKEVKPPITKNQPKGADSKKKEVKPPITKNQPKGADSKKKELNPPNAKNQPKGADSKKKELNPPNAKNQPKGADSKKKELNPPNAKNQPKGADSKKKELNPPNAKNQPKGHVVKVAQKKAIDIKEFIITEIQETISQIMKLKEMPPQELLQLILVSLKEMAMCIVQILRNIIMELINFTIDKINKNKENLTKLRNLTPKDIMDYIKGKQNAITTELLKMKKMPPKELLDYIKTKILIKCKKIDAYCESRIFYRIDNLEKMKEEKIINQRIYLKALFKNIFYIFSVPLILYGTAFVIYKIQTNTFSNNFLIATSVVCLLMLLYIFIKLMKRDILKEGTEKPKFKDYTKAAKKLIM